MVRILLGLGFITLLIVCFEVISEGDFIFWTMLWGRITFLPCIVLHLIWTYSWDLEGDQFQMMFPAGLLQFCMRSRTVTLILFNYFGREEDMLSGTHCLLIGSVQGDNPYRSQRITMCDGGYQIKLEPFLLYNTLGPRAGIFKDQKKY